MSLTPDLDGEIARTRFMRQLAAQQQQTQHPIKEQPPECDNWKHRSEGMRCRTCISFVPKVVERQPRATRAADQQEPAPKPVLGRCRKHAPTMGGFPVVFESDWCGDHKLDEEKL